MCLTLLLGITTTAEAQVEGLTYTVTVFSPTGGNSDGSMSFEEGVFTFDSSSQGELTGYYLETDDPVSLVPLVYAMYLNDQGQIQALYGQTAAFDLSILSISAIYGMGFGDGDYYFFGGYAMSFALPEFPF